MGDLGAVGEHLVVPIPLTQHLPKLRLLRPRLMRRHAANEVLGVGRVGRGARGAEVGGGAVFAAETQILIAFVRIQKLVGVVLLVTKPSLGLKALKAVENAAVLAPIIHGYEGLLGVLKEAVVAVLATILHH